MIRTRGTRTVARAEAPRSFVPAQGARASTFFSSSHSRWRSGRRDAAEGDAIEHASTVERLPGVIPLLQIDLENPKKK
jgi:hypothetical protein